MAIVMGSTSIDVNGSILTSNVIPSGAVMVMQQTNAPTGWTKSTAHNDKAMRVVTGTVSTGGTVAFSTAFASKTPSGTVSVSGGSLTATTLSAAQLPSHSHTFRVGYGSSGPRNAVCVDTNNDFAYGTDAVGGGTSHTHTFTAPTGSFTGSALDFSVQYVDMIIATKD